VSLESQGCEKHLVEEMACTECSRWQRDNG
jgi:hypothetical protein